MRVAALLAPFVALLGNPALADSYFPFEDQRIVDEKGRYYVLIERTGGPKQRDQWGPVNLTFAERGPGTQPMKSSRAVARREDGFYVMTKNKDITVRKRDIVHWRVKLDHPPKIALVSSTGLGVVLLDYYGINSLALKDGDALRILSPEGDLRYGKKLNQILTDDEIWRYDNRVGSIWWLRGAWIDDAEGEVVIIGSNYNRGNSGQLIAAVNLKSGKVRRGGAEDVQRAIAKSNPLGLQLALEIAMEMKLQDPKPHLPAILANQQLPLRARLPAAVYLAQFGEKTGASMLSRAALSATKHQLDDLSDEYDPELSGVVGYSVEHLPEVLGKQALPVLQEVSRKYGYSITTMQAFSELGEVAVPTLVSMLADQHEVDAQYMAVGAIWAMGPRGRAAVPALIKALDLRTKTSRGWRIDVMAVDALGQIGQEARPAVPALQKLASDGDKEIRMRALKALQRINK